MVPRSVSLSHVIGNLIPGSRTFTEFHDPEYQGAWFEITTFTGQGQEKQRLDFALPQELFNDMTDEEIAALVVRAEKLRREKMQGENNGR